MKYLKSPKIEQKQRKMIFISLLAMLISFVCGLFFLTKLIGSVSRDSFEENSRISMGLG
jgi:hypothetical protein